MKRILIVDDVSTNLICASEVLRDSYDVSTAKSGKQALLMINEVMPDLVLLDINMPDMNGYELFTKIKENTVFKDIPVIFLTGEIDRENEVKGLSMGAMDFIKKPFEPEIMKKRIDNILKKSEENIQLKHIAHKDGLTELLNRRSLEKILNEGEVAGKPGFFLLIDVDNFKKVNDTYGHVVGDAVLVRFARVLEEEVSKDDFVCRLGGDEFAILLIGQYENNEIRSIVRRLIAGSEFEISELLSENSDFKVSISIGIAQKPEDGSNFLDLYSNADKALYYVKQNGKRGYHFYHEDEQSKNTADEDNLIDLLQLQRLIQEKEEENGAYQVEYDGFRKIYHFVSRCMERKNQSVQLVLFTIADEDKSRQIGTDTTYISNLEKAISKSLRRGDVATKSGNTQFVVILMDASEQNGEMVANRICNNFKELVSEQGITLHYEMQSVNPQKGNQN